MYIIGTIIKHIEHELGQSTEAVPGLSHSTTRNYWLDYGTVDLARHCNNLKKFL